MREGGRKVCYYYNKRYKIKEEEEENEDEEVYLYVWMCVRLGWGKKDNVIKAEVKCLKT